VCKNLEGTISEAIIPGFTILTKMARVRINMTCNVEKTCLTHPEVSDCDSFQGLLPATSSMMTPLFNAD